ncbi:phospholipid carrier-dependent glycosyltransferase [Candidatus Roizmanbacteria bacterium]|nr:phospholipid carrier-dependent glycosyltransferase [Candidatus Roizmanbacteria bacterium]
MNKLTLSLLTIIASLSLVLNVVKLQTAPPGFNADEAAFGYNAYSISQTGKDEYGAFLPLRLKSFGDYKMPLYSYLSVPFIKIMGLTELSTRMLNIFLSFLFPIAVYFLAKELFKKQPVALLSALLSALSLGLHIVSRHAHEAYLAAFFITITTTFFLRFYKHERQRDFMIFLSTLGLSLFAYQSSRIFAVFFVIGFLVFVLRKRAHFRQLIILTTLVALIFSVDLFYKPERLKNLVFYRSPGLAMQIDELRREGGNGILYNKALVGIKNVISQQVNYFSPQFLAISGDQNVRFGYTEMPPLTILEYLFFFVGLYYVFKLKIPHRHLLVLLLFISPLTSALTWAETSLTRSLFILVPILCTSAFGIYSVIRAGNNRRTIAVALCLITGIELLLIILNWDFYLNHYPHRALPARSWQQGYKELSLYIKQSYSEYSHFYITRAYGQPYIFLLFYLNYPPSQYQSHATLSPPDQYGFGQVDGFDKFVFNLDQKLHASSSAIIAFPEDFPSGFKPLKKIQAGNTDVFWITENN